MQQPTDPIKLLLTAQRPRRECLIDGERTGSNKQSTSFREYFVYLVLSPSIVKGF